MKTKMIVIAVILAMLAIGILLSPRPATFSLVEGIDSISLANANGTVAYKDITSGSTIWVLPGDYQVKTDDAKFDTSKSTISVSRALRKSDFSISLPYTIDHLNSLIDTVSDKAATLLREKYGAVMDDYEIANAQLFGKADWYGAILINKNSTINDKKDFFRFVMKKEDDSWKLIRRPSLVIDKTFTEVPQAIAIAINNTKPVF